MPWAQVKPIIDPSVRKLCVRPYPLHPKGCPNYGKKLGCPPGAEGLSDRLDPAKPIYAVWNAFDFGAHVARMRAKHPDWSERQLACCLYWQGTARKALRAEFARFVREKRFGWVLVSCPEACGVNVTETMSRIGVELEWPPKMVAYQVALVGRPRKGGSK